MRVLDLKKWMVKVSEKLNITTANYTVTVGNSLYQGFYIADITLTKSNPAAIWVYVSDANRPAFAQRIDNSHVRVNCSVANTPVTVRCLYIPGVGGGKRLFTPLNRIAQILRKEVGIC